MNQRSCFILDEVEPTKQPCAKCIKSLFLHTCDTHIFQIPRPSSEAIKFFFPPQVCFCHPHDRSLYLKRGITQYTLAKPSVPCRIVCPPRHIGRSKLAKPKSGCPHLCLPQYVWQHQQFLLENNLLWCLSPLFLAWALGCFTVSELAELTNTPKWKKWAHADSLCT